MTTPNYPTVWYWVVQDTNPTTHVWESATGQMVANNSANYLSWVANGGRSFQFTPQHPVTAAVNNGSGLIRVTINSTAEFTTNDSWVIQNVVMTGATVINGTWPVTVINSTQLDLQGSTFVGSDSVATPGVIDRGTIMPTMALMLQAIDNYNQGRTPLNYLSVTSGVNYNLANTPPAVFDFTPTAAGLVVTLPQMNLPGSLAIGRIMLVRNRGLFAFTTQRFGALGLNPGSVPVNGVMAITLDTNTTQAGGVSSKYWTQPRWNGHGDADTTLVASSSGIQIDATTIAFTAARTWTLPLANTLPPGALVIVADDIGGITATNTLSVAVQATNKINQSSSSIVLNRAFDFLVLETDGSFSFTIIGGKNSLNFSDLLGTISTAQQGGTAGGDLSGTYPNPTVAPKTLAIGTNKFRNANFDIAQRGTSGTVTAGTTAYTLDGWQVAPTGADVAWAQHYFSDNIGPNHLNLACATGMTACTVQQRIESFMAEQLTDFSGTQRQITVQWQIRNDSGASFTPQIATDIPNAADNFSAVTADLAATNLQACPNGSNTLVAYTFTPGSSNMQHGYQIKLLLGGALNHATGSVSIALADVRVTPNAAAGLNGSPPPIELRPISEEMLFCERYLPAINYNGSTNQYFGFGAAFSTTQAFALVPFHTPTRAPITGILTSAAANFGMTDASATPQALSTLTWNGGGVDQVIVVGTVAAGTPFVAGNASALGMIGSHAQQILFTGAEL